ncbi:MAG: protein phosphatase [Pelagimonas sp.]|jgi:hypothetical protein|nr:protein phosphatase [Pelagimonas sp.]
MVKQKTAASGGQPPAQDIREPVVIRMMSVAGGIVAMSSLPGGAGDLEGDLDHLKGLQPAFVVTALSEQELQDTCAGDLRQYAQDHGARWIQIPVSCGQEPDARASIHWRDVSVRLRQALKGGGRIFVHGLHQGNRAKMLVLRLMIEAGEAPDEAEARLTSVWPGPMDHAAQRQWALGADRAPAIFMRHQPQARGGPMAGNIILPRSKSAPLIS